MEEEAAKRDDKTKQTVQQITTPGALNFLPKSFCRLWCAFCHTKENMGRDSLQKIENTHYSNITSCLNQQCEAANHSSCPAESKIDPEKRSFSSSCGSAPLFLTRKSLFRYKLLRLGISPENSFPLSTIRRKKGTSCACNLHLALWTFLCFSSWPYCSSFPVTSTSRCRSRLCLLPEDHDSDLPSVVLESTLDRAILGRCQF